MHTTKVEEGLALRALLPAELVGGWGVGAVPEGWEAVPSVSSRGREESQATPSPPEAAGTPHLRSRRTPRGSAPTRQPEVPPTPPQGPSAGAAFRLSGAMPKAPFIFLSRGLVNMEPASGDMGMLG